MTLEKNSVFVQTLWQIPLIFLLAGAFSIGVNSLRPDGIPLVGNWSEEARFSGTDGEMLVIELEQAEQLFDRDEVVFLDARPQSQYAEGHISGALNIPWQEVELYFIEAADQLEAANGKAIITYCDGVSCDLSHELALFLQEMGFENVRVLVDGWSRWKQAGLPVSREE